MTYANLASEPVEVELHSLPWSHTESTTDSGATLSLVAQVDGGSLGCRITVDNQVLDEQAVNHQNASVTCTVLAA